MDIKGIIFHFIGGIALFLYGMFQMSDGLEKIAGHRLKSILKNASSNPFKGMVTGFTATSILQSSSIVSVILIGLVNAKLIGLENAVSIIMGTNIGTTVTAQIIAFKVKSYALLMIGIGFFAFYFYKNERVKFWGKILFGLGLIFLGMMLMSKELKVLRENARVIGLLTEFGKVPLYGLLAGAVFTGIVQSSSLTTSMVVAMGMQGLIGLEAAVPLILGANIGTCVTGLISCIGTSMSAKRTAFVHLFFNIIGVAMFFFVIPPFINVVQHTASDLGRQIANAHTIFNVVTTVILMPAIPLLIKLVKMIVPSEEVALDTEVNVLDKRFLSVPSIALEQAYNEITRMIKLTSEMFADLINLNQHYKEKLFALVLSKEKTVDQMHREVNSYLTQLSEKSLSDEESAQISAFFHVIDDIERSGDHIEKMVVLVKSKSNHQVKFSEAAAKEVSRLSQIVRELYVYINEAWQKWNSQAARKALDVEDNIDVVRREYLKHHLLRQQMGLCAPEAALIYTELLRRLERLGDHSDNIAHVILTNPDFFSGVKSTPQAS